MTVAELIEKLKTMPPSLRVVIPWGYDYGGLATVETVSINRIGRSGTFIDKASEFNATPEITTLAVILEQ